MSLDPREERLTRDLPEGEIMLPVDELLELIHAGWNLYSTSTIDESTMGDSSIRKRFVFIRRVRTS